MADTTILDAPTVPRVGIGVLGHGSIARTHLHACTVLPTAMYPPPAIPEVRVLCGRDLAGTSAMAERYSIPRVVTDWRELVADPAVDLLINTAPNALHAEPSIATLRAGKHVLCEKPLARTAEEAERVLEAARTARGTSMVGFNYRFVPALRLARQMIEEGRLGPIHHFRGVYLKGSGPDRQAPLKWRHQHEMAGFGALGDLASHTLDLARWLVGEIGAVSGITRTFVPERPLGDGRGRLGPVTVDDAVAALLEFKNGAMGTVEATRFAPGHKNNQTIEVNGSLGSIRFSLERLNELDVYLPDGPPDLQGFRSVLVTESTHPFYRFWWPAGHIIGWEHTFTHQLYHLLSAISGSGEVAPYGATMEDGYRNVVVTEAIDQSARSGRKVVLSP
jgi:predicted dehydrogenase